MADQMASVNNLRRQFEQAGFTAATTPAGLLEVKKYDCACLLEVKGGSVVRHGPSGREVRGVLCELEDRGFQKFWLAKAVGRRFPIRLVELDELHRFEAEVRYHVGQTSLYHESLGTTNARTVYDRLENRPDR